MSIPNLDKGRLADFVTRIENVQEQIDGLAEDKKGIYAEAGGEGYDKAIIRMVIAHRKKLRKNRELAKSQLELFSVYSDAVGED